MAYRSSSSNAGASTSPATALPAGTTTDDIVLLFFALDMTSITATWPSGFTQLITRDITADGHSFKVAWKRATGSEPGTYTITTTATGTPDWICQAMSFSGRDTGASVVAINNNGGSNTLAASPLSLAVTTITAGSGSDLAFIATLDMNGVTNGPAFTAPSGFTERQDQESGWSAMTCATLNNQTGATGTITGTGTMTSGTAGWGAFLIAIDDTVGGGTDATITPGKATLTTEGRSASMNPFSTVFIREVLINEAGSPVTNRTGMSLLVWYSGSPNGTPDLSLSALTTDANGTASWSIATGTLVYNQPIFYVATDGGVSLSMYTCARMTPTYQA